MHNSIGDKVDSPLLQRPPALRAIGEDISRGWSILAETWLCHDDRIIGCHPEPRCVEGGWIIQYEVEREMSVEELYAASA